MAIKVKHPKYWEGTHEKPIVSTRDIMKQLDQRTALISYTCMVDGTLSILATTATENMFVIGKPIPELESMARIVSNYLSGEKISLLDYTTAAHGLYQSLMIDLPATIERLIIIPDGFLHNLPFESLLTDKISNINTPIKDYPFLLKRYAISYGYSVTLVHDQLKNKKQIPYADFLLGYGSPRFGDLKAIQPILEQKGLKYVIRDKANTATKSSFMTENLKKYKIIHISAHGNTVPQTEGLGLLLTGAIPIYYGDLYHLEIGADLVLLLACLSGKGKLVTGEGVIGLNRALYTAGAKNLLLYRENLNNEANTFFCQKFYEGITGGTQSYSAVLQKARIAMIESGTYANPIYWAGYCLIGY